MQGKEGWNYFRIDGLSLINRHYLYFDREQCSFSLLHRRNVHMRIKGVLKHQEEKYVVIDCKVRKKDATEFEAAMQELPNKMLICGYRDYDAFCDYMTKKFEAMKQEKNRGKARNARGHQENNGCREGRNCCDGSGASESHRGAESQL